MITGKNYIGTELRASGKVQFETYNSLAGKSNEWKITEATFEEINEAVELASNSRRIFAKVPIEIRAGFLRMIASNLKSEEELIRVYCAESSLDEVRAKAELNRTVNQLLMFADLVESKTFPEVRRHNGINDLRKTHLPLGPIAVFGSSNFPLAYSTVGGDTASALAAGCPVIVKAHPMHAGTGELVASCVVKAALYYNLPNGVFSNLNIRDHNLGAHLVQHDLLKGVGFTGSLKGGRALYNLTQLRHEPIPFFAEMGSLNPVCILPSALVKDAEKWANEYANSITTNAGQFCTKPGLIFLSESDAAQAFIERLVEHVAKKAPNAMLHPTIRSGYRETTNDSLKFASPLLTNQSNSASLEGATMMQCDYQDFMKRPELRREQFGPASLIIICKDLTEMMHAVESLDGQLTGTVLIGDSPEIEAEQFIEILAEKAGRIIVNGVPTGVEVCEATNHGGPYPASTDSRFTAVGTDAIKRWLRPVVYQNVPESYLPKELI